MNNKTSPFKSLLAALWIVASFTSTVDAASFPPTTGPFNTTIFTAQLTDQHRRDPLAPVPTARSLMISVFQPVSPSACLSTSLKYMEPITAAFEDSEFSQYGIPPGTFESLDISVCKNPLSRQRSASYGRSQKSHPLILFSPGLGRTRLLYTAMAQEISSFGYMVVTVDHPYDSDIVVFPNNSTILAADIDTDEQITKALDTRRKDVSFVLDQLSNPSIVRKILPGIPNPCIDVSKVGIYGHSLGGATAAEVMLYDSRLVGGVNLDGTFYGKVVQRGLTRPFLIFAHEGKNTSTDPSWQAIGPRLKGWKRDLQLRGSAHGTFTDLPSTLDVLGLSGSLPSEVAELLGSISGARGFEIMTLYVRVFFDMILRGKKSSLLDKPSPLFPEITFGVI